MNFANLRRLGAHYCKKAAHGIILIGKILDQIKEREGGSKASQGLQDF